MTYKRARKEGNNQSTDKLAENIITLTQMFIERKTAQAPEPQQPNDRGKMIVDMVSAQVRLLNEEQQLYYLQEITLTYGKALSYGTNQNTLDSTWRQL